LIEYIPYTLHARKLSINNSRNYQLNREIGYGAL